MVIHMNLIDLIGLAILVTVLIANALIIGTMYIVTKIKDKREVKKHGKSKIQQNKRTKNMQ